MYVLCVCVLKERAHVQTKLGVLEDGEDLGGVGKRGKL